MVLFWNFFYRVRGVSAPFKVCVSDIVPSVVSNETPEVGEGRLVGVVIGPRPLACGSMGGVLSLLEGRCSFTKCRIVKHD